MTYIGNQTKRGVEMRLTGTAQLEDSGDGDDFDGDLSVGDGLGRTAVGHVESQLLRSYLVRPTVSSVMRRRLGNRSGAKW